MAHDWSTWRTGRPMFAAPETTTPLEERHVRIAEAERRLTRGEIPLGAEHALAHARKEWGHASKVCEPGAVAFHLSIVDRDLGIFWGYYDETVGAAALEGE
jgi:hypothetical protein